MLPDKSGQINTDCKTGTVISFGIYAVAKLKTLLTHSQN